MGTLTFSPSLYIGMAYFFFFFFFEKTINNYKTSFSRVSNAISKPSSKIVGSKIVKKIEGGQSTKLSPAT